jgi:hypothetical protein
MNIVVLYTENISRLAEYIRSIYYNSYGCLSFVSVNLIWVFFVCFGTFHMVFFICFKTYTCNLQKNENTFEHK